MSKVFQLIFLLPIAASFTSLLCSTEQRFIISIKSLFEGILLLLTALQKS